MTTLNYETPFFPIIIESNEEVIENPLITYRDQIAPQLRAVIEKSPNPKAVSYAKKLLTEIERADNL